MERPTPADIRHRPAGAPFGATSFPAIPANSTATPLYFVDSAASAGDRDLAQPAENPAIPGIAHTRKDEAGRVAEATFHPQIGEEFSADLGTCGPCMREVPAHAGEWTLLGVFAGLLALLGLIVLLGVAS